MGFDRWPQQGWFQELGNKKKKSHTHICVFKLNYAISISGSALSQRGRRAKLAVSQSAGRKWQTCENTITRKAAHVPVMSFYHSFSGHPSSLPSLRLTCDATEPSDWDSTRLTSATPFSLTATALDTVPWRLDLEACQSSDTSTLLQRSLDALTRPPRLFWSPRLSLFFVCLIFLFAVSQSGVGN